jgi:hypothetical protein
MNDETQEKRFFRIIPGYLHRTRHGCRWAATPDPDRMTCLADHVASAKELADTLGFAPFMTKGAGDLIDEHLPRTPMAPFFELDGEPRWLLALGESSAHWAKQERATSVLFHSSCGRVYGLSHCVEMGGNRIGGPVPPARLMARYAGGARPCPECRRSTGS